MSCQDMSLHKTRETPVNLKFNLAANFRAFRSSSKSTESSYSDANAIALASPKSTCVARNSNYFYCIGTIPLSNRANHHHTHRQFPVW